MNARSAVAPSTPTQPTLSAHPRVGDQPVFDTHSRGVPHPLSRCPANGFPTPIHPAPSTSTGGGGHGGNGTQVLLIPSARTSNPATAIPTPTALPPGTLLLREGPSPRRHPLKGRPSLNSRSSQRAHDTHSGSAGQDLSEGGAKVGPTPIERSPLSHISLSGQCRIDTQRLDAGHIHALGGEPRKGRHPVYQRPLPPFCLATENSTPNATTLGTLTGGGVKTHPTPTEGAPLSLHSLRPAHQCSIPREEALDTFSRKASRSATPIEHPPS